MYGQLLLAVNRAKSTHMNKTIHIGYLLESKARAGAINVAIKQAQNDGLLRDHNFRYILIICNNCYKPKDTVISAQTLAIKIAQVFVLTTHAHQFSHPARPLTAVKMARLRAKRFTNVTILLFYNLLGN